MIGEDPYLYSIFKEGADQCEVAYQFALLSRLSSFSIRADIAS